MIPSILDNQMSVIGIYNKNIIKLESFLLKRGYGMVTLDGCLLVVNLNNKNLKDDLIEISKKLDINYFIYQEKENYYLFNIKKDKNKKLDFKILDKQIIFDEYKFIIKSESIRTFNKLSINQKYSITEIYKGV